MTIAQIPFSANFGSVVSRAAHGLLRRTLKTGDAVPKCRSLWLLKIPKSEKTIRVLGDGAVGSPPAGCSNGNRTALTADQL